LLWINAAASRSHYAGRLQSGREVQVLTYDDCLGFCELTPEEISAVARHEHLPDIAALEMGSWLCRTLQGKQAIRRMIPDDIREASERGDREKATQLQFVLHHFVETRLGRRRSPAEDDRHTDGAEDVSTASRGEPVCDELEYPMRALGLDGTTAPWVRERVDGYLTAMLRRFGLDRVAVQERFPSEMLSAKLCCAACAETARCRHFLDDVAGSEAPSAFCPNARLFDQLSAAGPRACDVG
jgi:hypothetical protein